MITTLAEPHPTQALISSGAFRHNLSCVRTYCGPQVKIMPVVKANAYGHGVLELSREAVPAGIAYLGVARVEEAIELRRSGIEHPILVFEIPIESHVQSALEEEIELTVSTQEGAEKVSRVATRLERKARVHVKVDTGMGRLGFGHGTAVRDVLSLLRLPHLELASVYSHFATSEIADKSFAHEQLGRFNDVIALLEKNGVEVPLRHMANSGAIITMPESHLDMVRPGIMLYGYTPAPGMAEQFPVRPVMSLVSKIGMVKMVEAGVSISYGRLYTTPARTHIATVPIGYADGYARLLTGRASALIRGKRYPVVGTICMDHVMVDIGAAGECQPGDDVTFIGSDGAESITAWDIAGTLGTIPYEVTCLIAPRVPRVFVE